MFLRRFSSEMACLSASVISTSGDAEAALALLLPLRAADVDGPGWVSDLLAIGCMVPKLETEGGSPCWMGCALEG